MIIIIVIRVADAGRAMSLQNRIKCVPSLSMYKVTYERNFLPPKDAAGNDFEHILIKPYGVEQLPFLSDLRKSIGLPILVDPAGRVA